MSLLLLVCLNESSETLNTAKGYVKSEEKKKMKM